MPGYIIHIAIAQEYKKKHEEEIQDEKFFIKGNLAPDNSSNKYESHYGNYAEKHIGLSKFLKETQLDLSSDYGKGYFLHLLADELFYHKAFEEEAKKGKFYHDYDCLNQDLFQAYQLKEIPEEAKKYVKVMEEKPELLSLDKVKRFIDEISDISIEEQIYEIKQNGNPIIGGGKYEY